MPTKAFISYSHADERGLERLHKHLSMLRREGSLDAWFDHAILPGTNLSQIIRNELDESELFLALVSPDYLASNYCYEEEFSYVLNRARAGDLRLVPIILEPCDWLSSPLSEFLALPKDGKPISEWTNVNNAYLDVVTGLRRVVGEGLGVPKAATTKASPGESVRKVRLKRDFDAIDRAEFRDRTFLAIQEYFKNASVELSEADEALKTRLESIGSSAFTCTIVNRAKVRQGEAHITVHNVKSGHGMGDISYIFQAHAEPGQSNGGIRVDADDYNLFLKVDNFFGGRDSEKYTPERAAEWLWNSFVERAGIEYE